MTRTDSGSQVTESSVFMASSPVIGSPVSPVPLLALYDRGVAIVGHVMILYTVRQYRETEFNREWAAQRQADIQLCRSCSTVTPSYFSPFCLIE